METLAVVHLETTAGSMRVSVSQAADGTLIAERIGAEWPFLFPIKVGEAMTSDDNLDDDATKLIQSAVDEIEEIAEVLAAKQIRMH